jgi:PKD repeat protein
VDASSAGGVAVGYNAFSFQATKADYSWAGTVYSTVADFQAAVAGEGTSDLDLPRGTASPAIDSANCAAPGELSTDLLGNPHVADPLATGASLGNGTCHADRGAIELQDSLPFTVAQSPVISSGAQAGLTAGAVPFADSLTVAGPATSPWNEPVTYTLSFGDGSAPVTATPGTAVPHTYTAVGNYTITITATDTGGSGNHATTAAYALPATPLPAILSAAPYGGGGMITPDMADFTASFGSSSWEVATDTLAYGDGAVSRPGTHATGATDASWTYDYDEPGTYTATLTQTDLLGRVSTAKATITVGDEVQDVIPKGVSYTAVPAHGVVKIPLSRFAPDCCGRNQLIDVTVTSPQRAGYVVVYADGTKPTGLATVQFQAGQAVENSALAANGPIDVYNASAGKINLDVTIYGITDTTSPWNGNGVVGGSYTPVAPVHVLPPTKVAGNRQVAFPVAGLAGVPASAADVVLDITSSHSGAAGHFVTWPERSSAGLYSLTGGYWAKGKQITSQVMVPVNGQTVLENASRESTFFTADVVGYYTYPAKAPGSVFLPATPTRLLKATVGARQWVRLSVTRKNGIPATGTTAVAVNLTEAGATATGTFTAYADGTPRPNVTSLSYSAGGTVATAAIVAVGKDGAIDIYNSGLRSVTLAVDLTGFYYAY